MEPFKNIVESLSQSFQHKRWMLATAESCTGGWVAQAITSLAGSSLWFERGFVTYSNQSKQELLGVKQSTLDHYGAVSEQTALEMAQGALKNSHADVSLAITGLAGPDGGQEDKPVGCVYFAWAGKNFDIQVERQHFSGTRSAIREQAVKFALERLLQIIQKVANN